MGDLIFGKYELSERLAIGGMGEVFLAHEKTQGLERPVILKSLLPDLAREAEFVRLFLDEARVAAMLRHPNVVSIYDIGMWKGVLLIAMEFIRGRSLADLFVLAAEHQVEMTPTVVTQIIHQAALGLHHAHQAVGLDGQPLHIVHRDISPQNLMVRYDGVTKVVDFGIALARHRSTRTEKGVLRGKVAYMSPEQLDDGEMGPASDQFSLGIVFWEALTGYRLFHSDREVEIPDRVRHMPIAPPSQVNPKVSRALDAVALTMLQRDPALRYADLGAAAGALREVLRGLSAVLDTPVAQFVRAVHGDEAVSAPSLEGTPRLEARRGQGTPAFTLRPVDKALSVHSRRTLLEPGLAPDQELLKRTELDWGRLQAEEAAAAAQPASVAGAEAPTGRQARAATPPSEKVARSLRPRWHWYLGAVALLVASFVATSVWVTAVSRTAQGFLSVRGEARVAIDGKDLGKGPVERLSLPAGPHRVSLNGHAVEVTVREGELVVLEVDPKSRL